jgi:translation initiation factor 2B subunit (eIF-2B alpha/beta/delta family)
MEHGAAYISLRALEVLRDRAALLAAEGAEPEQAWKVLGNIAVDLIAGHPSMAVLANRLSRVMYHCRESRSAKAVEQQARASIERAVADDKAAARHAAKLVAGRRVLTLSRSGTVQDALLSADPKPTDVVVAESHPGGEGVGVAKRLGRAGLSVTLIPDDAVVSQLEARGVELVLIGADSLLPSGAAINKVGSYAAALAAQRAGIPLYVVSATDKLRVEGDSIDPIFETVPSDAVTGIVTERGLLEPGELDSVAMELRKLADWSS